MAERSLAAALSACALLACGVPSAPAGDAPSAAPSGAAQAPADVAPVAPASPDAPAAGATPREGSVVARAPENDAIYVADEDHGVVRVVALPAELTGDRGAFTTPGPPAQIVVTKGRVLVTVRHVDGGEGLLLVLRRKGAIGLEEVARVPLPDDAWGVSVTPDDATALVTSAWTHKLTGIDLATNKARFTLDLAREPRGVVVLPKGDRAYVSHLVGADVTRIDGLDTKTPTVKRVELAASPLRAPGNAKVSASLGYAAIASPRGDRVYFPRHALGAIGGDRWFGVGAVDVLLTDDDSHAAPTRNPNAPARFPEAVAHVMETQRWMDGTTGVLERGSVVVEPRGVVYRKTTDTILVVNEGNDGIAELDALAMDPTTSEARSYETGKTPWVGMQLTERGGAPQGIALSAQEDQAYVFCRSTYDLVILKLSPRRGFDHVVPPITIRLAEETDKQLSMGRQLFYKANNGEVSGGVACAGCHPDGRDDGHVWHEITFKEKDETFTNFFGSSDLTAIKRRWPDVEQQGEGGTGYARQTPMLAGRVSAKGPYGWHGESPDIEARIRASFSLHRWRGYQENSALAPIFAAALGRFVREGLVPPARPEKSLTDEEQRGKALFESPAVMCATCHLPQSEYTDRNVVPFTKVNPPRSFAEDPVAGYKTPSLKYVASTAPYMHDGRFESLESLVEYNGDRMGKTQHLSADDRKALIAFLRTL